MDCFSDHTKGCSATESASRPQLCENTDSPRQLRLRNIAGGIVVAAFTICSAGGVHAHDTTTIQPLAQVPGATGLQSVTGQSVQAACQGMIPLAEQDRLSLASQALFARCGELVGSIPGSTSQNNLDLTNEQLNGALQQVATEEAIALGARGAEITSARLGGAITRLSELRRGATGFRISITNPTNAGGLYAGSGQTLGTTGGAAGDGGFLDEGRLSGFLNLGYGFGDKDRSDRENGFDFSHWGITAGLDYRVTDTFVVGGLLSYSELNADFDETAYSVSGGSADSDGWGLSAYGLYEHQAFYVDGLIGYGKVDYDLERRVFYQLGPDATAGGAVRAFNANADTESNDLAASLGIGFDRNRNELSYGPYARLSYYKVDIDGYRESGSGATELALAVDDQEVESFTSTLGARISYALSRSFGVVTPYARAEWIHEFDNDSRIVDATYVFDPNSTPLAAKTNAPDRDYGFLGVGISAVRPNGYQLFLDYQGIVGYRDLSDHRFVAGFRAEF